MATYYIVHTSNINKLKITNQEEYTTWFKLLVILAKRLKWIKPELYVSNILKSKGYIYIQIEKTITAIGIVAKPIENTIELTLTMLTDLALFGEVIE